MNTSTSSTDVLVIGGGQAGLATGYWLKKRDIDFQIIDGSARVGDSWRNRYDSLVLFTPRAFSALPGLPVPGDPEGYPTKDEIADYLETYALTHHLPVTLGTCATQLTQVDDDGFIASTSTGSRISTRTVIVASGGFQKPVIPRGALGFSSSVLQISASGYRNPSQVASGKVLVCGDGATGRQIAAELSRTHTVLLSTGRPRRVAPERLLGKSVFWWAAKLGLLRASRHSRIGKGMMRSDSFPGKHLRLGALRKLGITPVGRFLEAEGTTASFSDGLSAQVDAVIWSTGYREDDSWVDIPEAKDSNGVLLQERGRTPVSGLYTIGRNWQWNRGSALLFGVGADAEQLVRRVEQRESDNIRSPFCS